MTAAYSTFGNQGLPVVPHIILRVEGADGEVLWSRPEPESDERVLDPQAAFVVLDAMQAVVDRGTGSAVRAAGYRGAAAGKTGTTNEGRDAWFIGLTPDLVAGVWIGFDQPREIVAGRGGSALAAPVWGTWMRRAPSARDRGTGGWIPPVGVELVRYDPDTGEVLAVGCSRPLRADFPEAWVVSGSYEPRRCRGGIGGWLDRLWRGVSPGRAEPLRPLIRSSR
jgi:penicillin-binding protein 1A